MSLRTIFSLEKYLKIKYWLLLLDVLVTLCICFLVVLIFSIDINPLIVEVIWHFGNAYTLFKIFYSIIIFYKILLQKKYKEVSLLVFQFLIVFFTQLIAFLNFW